MYFRILTTTLAAALVLLGVATTAAMAQPRDRGDDRRFDRDDRDRDRGRRDWDRRWELLGEKRVGFRVDRDVISIGHREEWFRNRRFRALHFVAEGNDIHMMSIRLVYLNGFGEEFRVDRLIRRGEELPMDLRGERSFLARIEMVYRSRPNFRGDALIKVYGEPSHRRDAPPPVAVAPPDRDEWVELGCKQVALIGKDRDSIPVGRREGRFKAIRLQVSGADVEVLDLRVSYANGEPDEIPVRNLIRADSRTRRLDLRGFARSIERVDLTYRTVLNPIDIVARQRLSLANVCVEGLQ